MDVQSGVINLPANTTPVVVPLNFTPSGAFTITNPDPFGLDAQIGQGVIAGNTAAEQFATAQSDLNAVASMDSGSSSVTAGVHCCRFSGFALTSEYTATVTFQANQMTITPSTADFAVQVRWTVFDADAWIKVYSGSLNSASGTQPYALSGGNVAATAKYICAFWQRPGRTTFNSISAHDSFGASDGARFLNAVTALRAGTALTQGASGLYDSVTQPALNWRNCNALVQNNNNPDVECSLALTPNGNDSGLSTVIAPRGDSGIGKNFGVAGLNGADVAIDKLQLPASGVLQIRGLGFQPKYVYLFLLPGQTTEVTSNGLSARPQPPNAGTSTGFWTADLEFGYGYVRAGDADSVINLSQGAAIGQLPAPYSATVTLDALDADGFDLRVNGGDGTQHLGLWMAFGEPGGPPPDVNLTATLAGDSSISATLTIEPAPADIDLTATLPGDSDISATLTVEPSPTQALAATLAGDSAVLATLTLEPSPTQALTATLAGDSGVSATLTLELEQAGWLIGNAGFLYGFRPPRHPTNQFGALVPDTLAGERVYQLTANPSSNVIVLDLGENGGVQPAGLDVVNLSVEGAPTDPVLLSWTGSRYEAIDTSFSVYIESQLGNLLQFAYVKPFGATLAGDSSISANLVSEPPGVIQLTATLPGEADLTASLTLEPSPTQALTAALAGDSDISATLTLEAPGEVNLTATLPGDSNISANLTKELPGVVQLTATLAGDSTISATLTLEPSVEVALTATLPGDSGINAPLSIFQPGELSISATLDGEATITATLTTVVEGLPIVCDPTIISCTPMRTVVSGSVR